MSDLETPTPLIKTKTKAIKVEGTNPLRTSLKDEKNQKLMADQLGINGDNMISNAPRYIQSPSDTVINNNYNSWIILGRDRPSTRASGHGALGDTHAASIDIVAGLMGAEAKQFHPVSQEPIYCDPDMSNDAARIYISQKTNIDKNFGLIAGKVGTSQHKAGIGIKADGVRIMARDGIKLVTGLDMKNSQDSDKMSFLGVDIIAGNINDASVKADLQPMVKGTNLIQALRRLNHHIARLNGILDSYILAQQDYNVALMDHWHSSPYFTAPTTPSEVAQREGITMLITTITEIKKSLTNHKKNLTGWQANYLQQSGPKYINSRWNNVN